MRKIAFLIAAILIVFIAVKAATHQILRQAMQSGTEVVEGRDALPREIVEEILREHTRPNDVDPTDDPKDEDWVSNDREKAHQSRVEALLAGKFDKSLWDATEDILDGEYVWDLEVVYENNPDDLDAIGTFVFFDQETDEYWYVTSSGIGGWTYYTGPVAAEKLD